MDHPAPSATEPVAKRVKTDAAPGPVLHVRRLPPFCAEQELIAAVQMYGTVVRTFVMPDKQQGFIQFADGATATAVLQALELSAPTIRNTTPLFQFSNRESLTSGTAGAGEAGEGASNSILLLNISQVTVPITLENIHSICSQHGEVQKIITFTKNENFQALVQFASPAIAANAKMFLDGKNLFQGCCLLRVDFSNRKDLVVRKNDGKSRDYTQPMGAQPGFPGMQNPYSVQGGMGGILGQQGGMGGILGPQAGMGGFGPPGGMGGFGQGAMGAFGQGGMGGSPVVLVNNIPQDQGVTVDVLYILFGVYGNVDRVKILYSKRETAMIQYRTSQQAANAVQNLNGCPLMGSQIAVQASKNNEVKLHGNPNEPGSDLTKDYSTSDLHRFKGYDGPKTVNSPSAVLYVANIHETANEETLRKLFGSQQGDVAPRVEFFKNSRKMAYVAMLSVEHAVSALINLHNYSIGPWQIRVAFSNKDGNSIQDSDAGGSAATGEEAPTQA
jgi:hnRNP-L/PTB/hephaestus splicing factor